MRNKQHIALGLLAASAAGLALSLPYADTFGGGLIAAGCSAALVGGLADWFAVSAIFKRPLGISFKTDLIRRNRGRLAEGVGRMVSEELLAPAEVERFLAQHDLAVMLDKLFQRMDGKRHFRILAAKAAEAFFARLDARAVARMVRGIAEEAVLARMDSAVLTGAAKWLTRQGAWQSAVRILKEEAQRVLRSEEMGYVLTFAMKDALEAYERGGMGRSMLHGMIGLTPESCAEKVQAALLRQLAEAEEARLAERFTAYIAAVDTAKVTGLVGEVIEEKITAWLEDAHRDLIEKKEDAAWIVHLADKAEGYIDQLILDREKNRAFNEKVRAWIAGLLSAHQEQLAELAKRGVDSLPDEMLTGFMEKRVGHDLQMIRVNGSLVGGLAGAALYLLRYLTQGVIV